MRKAHILAGFCHGKISAKKVYKNAENWRKTTNISNKMTKISVKLLKIGVKCLNAKN